MKSFLTNGVDFLLALAVFAFAVFSLQVNLSASQAPPDVGQATSAR